MCHFDIFFVAITAWRCGCWCVSWWCSDWGWSRCHEFSSCRFCWCWCSTLFATRAALASIACAVVGLMLLSRADGEFEILWSATQAVSKFPGLVSQRMKSCASELSVAVNKITNATQKIKMQVCDTRQSGQVGQLFFLNVRMAGHLSSTMSKVAGGIGDTPAMLAGAHYFVSRFIHRSVVMLTRMPESICNHMELKSIFRRGRAYRPLQQSHACYAK